MNTGTVWIIIGADEGLGPAAVKYLTARQQRVIALVQNNALHHFHIKKDRSLLHIINMQQLSPPALHRALNRRLKALGALHCIINNGNYNLFQNPQPPAVGMRQRIDEEITKTLALVKMLLPYLNEPPRGRFINLPPQLCLTMIHDQVIADLLSGAMTLFLNNLHRELQGLNCGLHFLLPGETELQFNA